MAANRQIAPLFTRNGAISNAVIPLLLPPNTRDIFPLAMRYGPKYSQAGQIQDALYKAACDESNPARDRAQCAKEWRELEFAKREWRGLPRLTAHSLKDLMDAKQRAMRQLPSSSNYQPYTELTESERQAEAKGKTVWEE
jgi:hypothetical protein